MTYKLIESPIELTDDQLDMVAAGHGDLLDVDVDVEDNCVNILGIQDCDDDGHKH